MDNYNEMGKNLSGENHTGSDSPEFKDIQQIWDLAGSYKFEDDKVTDEGWAKLQSRMNASAPLKVSWIRRNAYAVAASVAILFTAGAGFWMANKSSETQQVASITQKTGSGEIRKITLSDGSVITMNSNSEIIVSAGFNEGNRNIELKGEATFEVAHNENLPFRVVAAGTETKVLGTGFDICAYEGENVKIFVTHGRVQFGTASSKLILTKGKSGSQDYKTLQVSEINADSSVLGWKNEIWAFKSASLYDIATQIKHKFGKSLKFDSKFNNKQFTGKFSANTSAENIARTLSEALKVPITLE